MGPKSEQAGPRAAAWRLGFEPHIVLETVGDSELVYRVRPERGGRKKVLRRNSLKLCTGSLPQPQPPAPQLAGQRHAELPMLYCVPAINIPADINEGPATVLSIESGSATRAL